jgi:hypothetical protein
MADPKRYWRPVLMLTLVFCVVAAVAYWVVPQVRDGTVPALGGLIWHPLGAIRLLITDVYGPIGARVGEATAPGLGLAVVLALTGVGALVLSMVLWLPFYLLGKRDTGS